MITIKLALLDLLKKVKVIIGINKTSNPKKINIVV